MTERGPRRPSCRSTGSSSHRPSIRVRSCGIAGQVAFEEGLAAERPRPCRCRRLDLDPVVEDAVGPVVGALDHAGRAALEAERERERVLAPRPVHGRGDRSRPVRRGSAPCRRGGRRRPSAARRRPGRRPRASRRTCRPSRAVRRASGPRPARPPSINSASRPVRLEEDLVVGDADPPAGRRGGRGDRVAAVEVDRHRLLEDHVAAGLERVERDRQVEVVRQADVDARRSRCRPASPPMSEWIATGLGDALARPGRGRGRRPRPARRRASRWIARRWNWPISPSPQSATRSSVRRPAALNGSSPSSAATCARQSLAAASGSRPSTCS